MSCTDFEALFDAYVEGEPDPSLRARVDGHVQECPDCRRSLDELQALLGRTAELPRAIEPGRDLFPGIRARIDRASASNPAPQSGFGTRRMRWIGWAAALVLLSVGGASLLWMRDASDPRRTTVPVADAVPAVASSADAAIDGAVREYVAAAELLEAAIEERRDRLSPETLAVLEKNLTLIDQAIDELRAALEAEPGGGGHETVLRAMHQQKVDLLRKFTRWTS